MKYWFNRNIYREGNGIELLQSGHAFFNEVESLIRSATHVIHIQIYIFDEDNTGKRVISLLEEAIARGVEVYIVVDGYGSGHLPKHTIRKLKAAGMKFKKFTPIHTSFHFRVGRRLHHKIILADTTCALIGGINIAEKYEGTKQQTAWLDFAVKIKGPLCKDVLQVCEDIWGKRMKWTFKKKFHHAIHVESRPENMRGRLLQNDWVRGSAEISASYRQSIRGAEQSVFMVASYFFPGTRIRRLLRKATSRGVKITLLLSGVSDIGLIKPAMNYLYPFLLRNHVEVYEWQASMMHGKMMVLDDKWTSVGSYNINALSDYGSLELNVGIDDEAFAKHAMETIHELMRTGCKQIMPADFEKPYWWNSLYYWISYQAVRISQRLLFFFMRR